MENMENVGMEVMSETPAEVSDNGLGKTVLKGVAAIAVVGLAVKGAIWLGKKVKGAFKSKKDKNADVIIEDVEEACEEE